MSDDARSRVPVQAVPAVSDVVRVVILSDDRLFAEGIVRILSSDKRFAVVLAANGEHTVRGEGEIVLLDSRMPAAWSLCEHLSRDIRARVVFIATPDDDEWAANAIASGARGLLTRNAGAADMISAIRGVAEGLIWARRRVISAMIDRLSATASMDLESATALEARLSIREREICRQAAAGLGNKELAARFDISEATVKVHLTHIFRKLGLRGRSELAAAYYGAMRQPMARLLSFGSSRVHGTDLTRTD